MEERKDQLYLTYTAKVTGGSPVTHRIEVDSVQQADTIRATKLADQRGNDSNTTKYERWLLVRGNGSNQRIVKNYAEQRPRLFIEPDRNDRKQNRIR